MNSKVKGIIAGIFSGICYGLNPVGAEFLYEEAVRTTSVLFYRFFLGILLLGIFLLIRRTSFRVSKRDLTLSAVLGCLMGISSITLFSSFKYMDSGIASTLLFLYPVIVTVIMVLFFRKKPTFSIVISILLSLAGVAVLSIGSSGFTLSWIGVILIFIPFGFNTPPLGAALKKCSDVLYYMHERTHLQTS